jgi:hypothetical protein
MNHDTAREDHGGDEVLMNIDGVDVLTMDVEAIELIGGPRMEGGELIQRMNVTFRKPLRYFVIDLSPKTCLSCGAKPDPYGNLPCGH